MARRLPVRDTKTNPEKKGCHSCSRNHRGHPRRSVPAPRRPLPGFTAMMPWRETLGVASAMLLVGTVVAQGPREGAAACSLPGHTSYAFCNTSLSLEDRVNDLISRIHDEDKPNLLTARGGPHGMQALDYIGVPQYYWGTSASPSPDSNLKFPNPNPKTEFNAAMQC